MRQLVGLPCVTRVKPIGSIVDGRYCTECGCPVHLKCTRPTGNSNPDAGCSVCGAKRPRIQEEKAHHEQDQKERAQEQAAGSALGFFGTYQLVRLAIGGVACGVGGIGLLLWEADEGFLSYWAVVRALLISLLGFALAGVLFWRWARAR